VPGARLYLHKNYHSRQVAELYDKIDARLIPRYAKLAANVAWRVRLTD